MQKKLRCRVGRHKLICVEQIRLKTDGSHETLHWHECFLQCGKRIDLPAAPLDDEYAALLRDFARVQQFATVFDMDTTATHRVH